HARGRRSGPRLTRAPNPTYGSISVMASGYAKLSVTLPAPLVERIRGRVGARGVSRYIADALETQERSEALRAWLAEQEVEHGPLPDGALEEARRQWLDAAGHLGR